MAEYPRTVAVPIITLTGDEVLQRFHLASNGFHGFIANLLVNALEATDGHEQVCLNHLNVHIKSQQAARRFGI